LGRLNTQTYCSVLDKFSGDPSFRAGEPPVLSPTVIAVKQYEINYMFDHVNIILSTSEIAVIIMNQVDNLLANPF
jgi:hypothetical protein